MRLLTACGLLIFVYACTDDLPPVPKPRSYPRVEYPVRDYERLGADFCPFTFERPASATVVRESSYFDDLPADSCWFNLRLAPQLNGTLHFSYYPITSHTQWEGLRDEAFELVGVHNQRASDIQEIVIHRDSARVHGVAFDIAGPAASPFQFFLTDSSSHFLRGALYFQTQPNPDSLNPVIDYVKEDIFRIVETLEWR